jgi:spore protease
MPDFKELSMREVYVLETGVLAQTGVESALQLKYLCDGIKPGAVIAVDSLACMETEKLGKTVQVTDSGISPGSGVKNMRNEISRKTLGVPVIAVGVPTVADTVSVLDGRLKDFGEFYDTVIVPRDIDILINRFAEIIADALNRVLNPSLSKEELERLTLF